MSQNNADIIPEIVDKYYKQMEARTFTTQNKGGMEYIYKCKTYFFDGHHRMNAAIKYYFDTGDRFYIDLMLNNSRFILKSEPPVNIYPFKSLKK